MSNLTSIIIVIFILQYGFLIVCSIQDIIESKKEFIIWLIPFGIFYVLFKKATKYYKTL